jgi:3-hydroxy-3-methylglutaryl CoA synthase
VAETFKRKRMLIVSVIGIDSLNIYAGSLAIDSVSVARCRNISTKMIEDIGFKHRSIVPSFEDPVTLAVNAAKPLIDETDPGDYGLLIVGTESGFDYGKPMSTYIHKYLGLQQHCRNFEIKHACYSGSAALQMAAAWLRSGTNFGKKALVITTDVARPHFNDPAELTAGSGAVAMVLANNPAILTLDPLSGYATREVYDVARPTTTFEWGDPVLSLYSFIDLLEASYLHYCKNNQITPVCEKQFDYLLYHAPLISLVKQSHRALLELTDDSIEPLAIAASFNKMVAPALKHNLELGNIYSGSLYVALAGLIENCAAHNLKAKIGLFSYGSGACAEFFSGNLTEKSQAAISKRKLNEMLSARRILSVSEYEETVINYEKILSIKDYRPDCQILGNFYKEYYQDRKKLVIDNINNYYRSYRWS